MLTPRHPLRSRFTPLWLHRRQLRCARLCALLTVCSAALFALLLQGFTQRAAWSSDGERGAFTGIPYIAAENAAPQTASSARPAPRRVELPAAPPSAPPSLALAAELPEAAETQEQQLIVDIPAESAPLTLTETDDFGESADTPAVAARPSTRPAAEQRRSAARAATALRTPPAYREAPKPPYPPTLRARRISGSVGVRIAVSAEGLPTEVTITSPSGHSEFDSTVRRWILAHWRFLPAQADGLATAAHVQTRIDFVPQ